MIEWTAFSWSAFATLTTGGFAVLAAAYVGSGQLEILKNQNILKEQEIRISLFEKRIGVFQSVTSFVNAVLVNGAQNGSEEERGFIAARLNARFLFSEELIQFLDEIWSKYCDLGLYRALMKDRFPGDREKHLDNVQKQSDCLKWFLDASANMTTHFSEIKPLPQ